MMKLFVTTVALMGSLWARADFSAGLSVSKVYNSKTNQYAAGVDKETTCNSFKGTYHGNSIVLTPSAKGGSGRYSHKLVWQISESYKTFDLKRVQREAVVKDGYSYRLDLPELKDDVPYVQQSVFLISQDLKTGKKATKQIIFNVSRPVILAHTTNPGKLVEACHQVFPAFPSTTGIMSNSSNTPSQLTIRHSIQSIWTNTAGSQWGYYISPLAWTVVGNVFSFYRNYFTQFSRQTIETIEVASNYSVSPGDFVQLYEQRTRYVTPFDIYQVDSCGHSELVEGTYFMQWWGRAYHAVPVNPYDREELPVEAVGVAPSNNCPDELTPEFARDYDDYIFSQTI